MASKIDLSTLNENFPVAGVDQPSQGFRTNFASIKRNILQAKTEINLVNDTKFVVNGDASGTSVGVIGDGTSPVITLTLANSGVTPATVNTGTGNVQFTVDSKGRITALAVLPRPANPALAATFSPRAIPFAEAGNNTSAIELPTFTFNQYGELTGTGTKLVDKLSAYGQYLPAGSIWSGGLSSTAITLDPPYGDFTGAGDNWVISFDPNRTDQPLYWRKLTIPVATTLSQGTAIRLDKAGIDYKVNLDLTKLTAYPDGSSIVAADTLVFYSTRESAHYSVSVSRLTQTLSSGLLTKVSDDKAPRLGADLDSGSSAYTSTASTGVRIGKPTDVVKINDKIFPNPNGQPANMALVIGTDGNMTWAASTGGGNANIVPGEALATVADPVGTVLNLRLLKLAALSSFSLTDYFPLTTNTGSQYRLSMESLMNKTRTRFGRVVGVDATYGNDTTGDGSVEAPYRTFTKALSALGRGATDTATTVIMVGPGVYAEDININQSNVHIYGVAGALSTTITGKITLNRSTTLTSMQGITVDRSSNDTSVAFDPARTAISTSATGCDGFTAIGCRFIRSLLTSGEMLPVISLSGGQGGQIRFVGCEFRGLLSTALTVAGPFDTVEVIDQLGNSVSTLGIKHASNRLIVTRAQYLGDVIHNGGVLELNTVDAIAGNGNSIASTASSGLLIMRQVDLYRYSGGTLVATQINKSGSCPYHFVNVNRNSANDALSGPPV